MYFKLLQEDSYNRYRTYMQLLDCAVLDVHSLQYKPRTLVAAPGMPIGTKIC